MSLHLRLRSARRSRRRWPRGCCSRASPAPAVPAAQPPPPARAAAERALLAGRYDEVHTLVAALGSTIPRRRAARPGLRRAVGRYAEAEKVLQPAVVREPDRRRRARTGAAAAHARPSREALRTLTLILSRDIVAPRRADYVRAGRAARALGRFQDANGYFREAGALAPDRRRRQHGVGRAVPREAQPAGRRAVVPGGAAHDAASTRRRSSAWRAPWPTTTRRWPASCAQQVLADQPATTAARTCCWPSWRSTTPSGPRRKAEIDKALAINPNSLEALALSAALAWLEESAPPTTGGHDRGGAQDNPLYGEVLPRRRRAWRPATTASRKPPSWPGRAIDDRSREQPGLRRSRRAPDAHRRRTRRAPRARDGVPRRSLRRRHLQPARPARHARRASRPSATATW